MVGLSLPRYLFLTVMDEPQATPETHGFTTAAWNSGSVTGKIISRVAPILGLPPRFDFPPTPFPLLAKLGYGMANVPAPAHRWLPATFSISSSRFTALPVGRTS